MKQKEIERKFLIDSFPEGLEELSHAEVEQGYLCLEPEVRIRHAHSGTDDKYILCIKGRGRLMRTEVETELDADQYTELKGLLNRAMITKEYRTYRLDGGLVLECSHVNKGSEGSFLYAEIEFKSEEEALLFEPIDCLGEELTYSDKFRMSEIWKNQPELA